MAIITPQLLQSLQVAFSSAYQQGLGEATPMWDKVATKIASAGKSTTYGWLGKFPGFREWVGDRAINSMAAHGYSIINKHFESSIGVDRNDLEDDEIGVYAPLFKEMGMAAAAFPDQQVFSLLDKGFTETCYDGQYFFDTDHPVAENADGTGAVTSVSNMEDGTGQPWYLLSTQRALKPLIYQERKAPKFTRMDQETDESVFMRNEYRYGIDMRCNVGFGFWQMAFASKQELTRDNVWSAYESMRGFKADGGKQLGLRPNLLVVCGGMEKQANEVLKELVSGGETNTLHNKVELLVPDYL